MQSQEIIGLPGRLRFAQKERERPAQLKKTATSEQGGQLQKRTETGDKSRKRVDGPRDSSSNFLLNIGLNRKAGSTSPHLTAGDGDNPCSPRQAVQPAQVFPSVQ